MLWHIDQLLSGDSVNSSHCLVTASKHVNNMRAIAMKLPLTIIEGLLEAVQLSEVK
jgi:hypothetical protein